MILIWKSLSGKVSTRKKKLFTIYFSHNDIHSENMMVGVGPYVAESHMLIDFDNAAWGYRGFDFNYFFAQVSYAVKSEIRAWYQPLLSYESYFSFKTFQKTRN